MPFCASVDTQNNIFVNFQRIQQASAVMEGHFAPFVSAIIIKITNDLPEAQDTSSKTKSGRNAFRALRYEFTLFIAFIFLEM